MTNTNCAAVDEQNVMSILYTLKHNEAYSLLNARNKAWSPARRNGDRDHWLTFRQLRNKCTSYIRKATAEFYLQIFTNSATNSSKFWKTINLLNNKSLPIPNHIVIDDQQFTDQREICQAFNTHFAAAGHLFDNINMEAPFKEIDTPSAVRHGLFTIHHFFPHLVAKALNTINTKKSTGEEKFAPLFSKVCDPDYFRTLHIFLIYLFYHAEFPVSGKQHI